MQNRFSQEELEALYYRLEAEGVACQNFAMHIDKDGAWYHQGGIIKRLGLVRVLAGLLVCLEDGSYWLVNPAEYGRIGVEDAPFIATTAVIKGAGEGQAVDFITNLGAEFPLNKTHPLFFGAGSTPDAPRPYIALEGRLTARVSRGAFYDLGVRAAAHRGRIGVWSYGTFFALDGEA